MLQEKINQYIQEVNAYSTEKMEELEQFRLKFLSKKGIIQDLFAGCLQVP